MHFMCFIPEKLAFSTIGFSRPEHAPASLRRMVLNAPRPRALPSTAARKRRLVRTTMSCYRSDAMITAISIA